MKLVQKFRSTLDAYSRQFWAVVFGAFLSTFGFNLIWAYLMIIISEQLNLGLTQSGSLMMIFSAAVIFSYIVLTPLVDRFGRKPFMVVGLILSGASFVGISFAHSYWGMAAFLVVSGLTFPFYEIGADSMVADLVPKKELESAYAFSRVGMNVGFAFGPLVGGFLVVISHQLAMQVAGLLTILAGVSIFFMIRETLPDKSNTRVERIEHGAVEGLKSGYASIFSNKTFLVFLAAFLLAQFAFFPMLSMGSFFAKNTLGIPENAYGVVPTINGIMNILFLVAVAGWTKCKNILWVLGLGSLMFSIGTGISYLAQGLGWLIASMVVVTIGELMIVPTAVSYVSKSAPADSRATYLGVYHLMMMVAVGLAPVIFGLISDVSNMRVAWLIMSAIGFVGCIIFFIEGRNQRTNPLINRFQGNEPSHKSQEAL